MTSREIVRDIVQLQRTVSQINDEIPDAGLTLTRTALQAITTAGTTIVWQSRIRGQGMTWSGSDITIPSDGWYMIAIAMSTSVALSDITYRLLVNATLVQSRSAMGSVARQQSSALFTRYYRLGDIVQIAVLPSANVNIVLGAENSIGESPILHIVQLTNQAEV